MGEGGRDRVGESFWQNWKILIVPGMAVMNNGQLCSRGAVQVLDFRGQPQNLLIIAFLEGTSFIYTIISKSNCWP